MKPRYLPNRLRVTLLIALIGPTAWAADVPVSIVDFAFDPMSVNINVNDTVVWTWTTDQHSSTADGGLWDSGVFNTPHVYSFTFKSVGDFPYLCVVHGFTGDVNVQVATNPPTVTLTNPPAGATFSAPATIQLEATAADSDGTIASVQLYEGPTLLAKQTNSPYSFVVSNLAAGPYTFLAVATDTGGLSATNAVSIQVVAPVATTIGAPLQASPGTFQFSYGANPGLTYVVQRALTLTNWISINTNTAAGASVLFQDNSAPTNTAYYRVKLLPNP
jgi:plastocyanin